MTAGEVVDVVLEVLVPAGRLLDSEVLGLDETVQEVVLLTVLLLLVDGHHGPLGVLPLPAAGRGEAELPLDAQLGRLLLLLLRSGGLGTYWGRAGGVTWDRNSQ